MTGGWWLTPSCMCCAQAAPGGWCPTTWCPGGSPTDGSAPGRRIAPGPGPRPAARSGARPRWPGPPALGGRAGRPVGQDRRGWDRPRFDAGKRVTGRKRHLLVDTLGLLLICVVHAASVQDRAGGRRPAGARACPGALPAAGLRCGRRRLRQPGRHRAGRLGQGTLWAGAGDRAAPSRAAGLCGVAAPLGGGTDVCVAGEVKAVGPRL